MKAILFDLDGVMYQGGRAIPGAAEALAWVRAQQIPHLFLTNTSSRPRRLIVQKLAGLGMAIDAGEILSPAAAAADWLKAHQPGPLALFVAAATREEFAGLPLLADGAGAGAGAVVIGDLGQGWDFATLNRAFRLLMAEPRPQLIALGMTRYWQAGDGLRLDVAPFVAALERAADAQALVLGKPAAAFFQAALAQLGVAAADALMLGDDIVGDIQGAQDAGLRAALVRTGKFRPADLRRGVAPDAVLGSIAELPQWWASRQGG